MHCHAIAARFAQGGGERETRPTDQMMGAFEEKSKHPFTTSGTRARTGCKCDPTLSLRSYPARTNNRGKAMTKFTMAAFVAIFAVGAIIGRASAPVPAMASETQRIASYELTLKAGPLPVQSFDAI